MILLTIAISLFFSTFANADLVQDRDGDLYLVSPKNGKVSQVKENKKYSPYKIISTNLIQDRDGDIYRVDATTGKVYTIKLDTRYAPYTSIK